MKHLSRYCLGAAIPFLLLLIALAKPIVPILPVANVEIGTFKHHVYPGYLEIEAEGTTAYSNQYRTPHLVFKDAAGTAVELSCGCERTCRFNFPFGWRNPAKSIVTYLKSSSKPDLYWVTRLENVESNLIINYNYEGCPL